MMKMPIPPGATAGSRTSPWRSIPGYLLALASTAMAALLGWLLQPWLSISTLSLVFLTAVLVTAVAARLGPALLTAASGFLAYNFLFTDPRFSFHVDKREDLLTMLVFLIVAVLAGHLASRLKSRVLELQQIQRLSDGQMQLARDLARCIDELGIVQVCAHHLGLLFNGRQPQWSMAPDVPDIDDASGPNHAADRVELRSDPYTMIAFMARHQCRASISVPSNVMADSELRERTESLASLVNLAWQRILLADRLHAETLVKEREMLRSALLSSVSHDLRTPLATMIGSVSTLLEMPEALAPEQRRELLESTLSEAERLNRYIQNLLDMARLGHGELALERDWIGIDDIAASLRRRRRGNDNEASVEWQIAPGMPLLHVHPALLEQALHNIIENAEQAAPRGSVVQVSVSCAAHEMLIDIHDDGPGIDPDIRERIFDMYFSAAAGDQRPAGTGLGLAISQGIIGAHGGRLRLLPAPAEGGTTFRIQLPLPDHTPEAPGEDE
jgi:two-component system, OmpR family, sensor histidine kinase KdpD